MRRPRLATKSRTQEDCYYVRLNISAKTLARLKRIMTELGWDARQVLECGVDLLYLGTTRKDTKATAYRPTTHPTSKPRRPQPGEPL